MGFVGALLAAILPIIILVGDAEDGTGVPTINASFTARPIQDATTCVVPCVVHFDAIGKGRFSATPYVTEETTDSTFSREFHSLLFTWDFGDPNDTSGLVWPNSGALKNQAIGGLAGHTYYTPGTYTVRLTVTNPLGETDTTTETVTVADPSTAFSTANTFCFANDNNDWNGCPLDCTTDDNCTVGSNFTTLLSSGNNCSGSDDCGASGTTKQRYLFRRGDTFTMSSRPSMVNSVAPGLIENFGTGAKPNISATSDLQPGSGWTLYNLILTSSGGADNVLINDGFSRVSLVDFDIVRTDSSTGCYKSGFTPSQDTFPYLLALVNFTCIGLGDATIMWPKARYMVWMGGEIDKEHAAQSFGHYYSMRAFHAQHWVMQHTYWHNATSTGQNWQWRQYDEEVSGACDDAYCASSYNLISDNINENPINSSTSWIRVCGDSGCNCESGGGSCGISLGEQRDVHDWIFERNLIRGDPGPAAPNNFSPNSTPSIFEITGGSHSIRDNVIDVQGAAASSSTMNLVKLHGSFAANGGGPASPTDTNTSVINNTIFNDDSVAMSILLVSGSPVGSPGTGCSSGCIIRNNLAVTPNNTSSTLTTSSGAGSYTASDNTRSNTEAIFASAPPEAQLTSIDDFALAASDTVAKDTGYDFSAETDRWGHTDARGFCRPFGTGWDKGALEYGASTCGYGSGINQYHVATASDTPPGSDSNAGSRDLPWLTLDHAFGTAGVSDVVWVHEGTYAAGIDSADSVITGGSDWATRLIVSEFPGDDVTLRPTSGTRVVFLADGASSYIELNGMDIDADLVTSDAVKITCEGVDCETNGTDSSDHIRLRDMEIMNSTDQGVLITGVGSTHNELIGLTIHDNGDNSPVDDHGIYISTANNVVKDSNVYSNATYGIIFYSVGGSGVDSNLAHNNDCHDNGTLDPSGAGILIASGTGNTATLNRCYANQSYGIHVDDDSINGDFHHNWLYGNATAPSVVDAGATGTVSTPNVLVAP